MNVETREAVINTESTSVSDDTKDVGSLLSRLGQDVGALISTEVNLAKAEVGESLSDAKKGAASLVIGAVVLFVGLLVLLNGVARTLAAMSNLESWASFLIVGGIISAIGAILLVTSKSKLSADNLALNRTESSLRKDQQVVKENLS